MELIPIILDGQKEVNRFCNSKMVKLSPHYSYKYCIFWHTNIIINKLLLEPNDSDDMESCANLNGDSGS